MLPGLPAPTQRRQTTAHDVCNNFVPAPSKRASAGVEVKDPSFLAVSFLSLSLLRTTKLCKTSERGFCGRTVFLCRLTPRDEWFGRQTRQTVSGPAISRQQLCSASTTFEKRSLLLLRPPSVSLSLSSSSYSCKTRHTGKARQHFRLAPEAGTFAFSLFRDYRRVSVSFHFFPPPIECWWCVGGVASSWIASQRKEITNKCYVHA